MGYAVELSPEQSTRILQDACAPGRPLHLLPKAQVGGKPQAARVRSLDEELLSLQLDQGEAAAWTPLVNTYCTVEMNHHHDALFFDGPIIAVHPEPPGVTVTVACPSTVLVRQRRRSDRLHLADSSTVQLSRWEGQQLLSCEGRLYNLSPSGMAFQLHTRHAAQIEIGQQWTALFEVPELQHCFRVEGLIRRKVPSSADQFLIVGLEFDGQQADHEDMQELRHYLQHRQWATLSLGDSR